MNAQSKSARSRVNLTVRKDYLDEARKAGVNLSRVLEDALSARLKAEREQRWLEQNREAIAEYNAYIEKYGCFSDGFRSF